MYSMESVIDSTVLGATTWPGMIENQADLLGLILSSTAQGKSGTRYCPAVCDSSSSVGVEVRYYVCVYLLRLR